MHADRPASAPARRPSPATSPPRPRSTPPSTLAARGRGARAQAAGEGRLGRILGLFRRSRRPRLGGGDEPLLAARPRRHADAAGGLTRGSSWRLPSAEEGEEPDDGAPFSKPAPTNAAGSRRCAGRPSSSTASICRARGADPGADRRRHAVDDGAAGDLRIDDQPRRHDPRGALDRRRHRPARPAQGVDLRRARLLALTLACGFAQTPMQLALFRFLAGFGLGGCLPTAIAMVTEFSRGATGKASTTVMTGYHVGAVATAVPRAADPAALRLAGDVRRRSDPGLRPRAADVCATCPNRPPSCSPRAGAPRRRPSPAPTG